MEKRIDVGSQRRGMLAPAVAVALLAVMGCVALVLDRLWLDAATVELVTVAEGAALAAGRELADDDLLRADSDAEARIERARRAAGMVGDANLVAGEPVAFDLSHDGDIRFGRLIANDGTNRVRFLESSHLPTTVVVTAQRTKFRGNPVALLFQQVQRQPAADAAFRAEATIDNRLIALRPWQGTPIPAFPLAIDSSDSQAESWTSAIDQRAGGDRFACDPATGRVSAGADGLPEIILRSRPRSGSDGDAAPSNLQLLDLGNDLRSEHLSRQLQTGLTSDDLQYVGGEIPLPQTSLELTGTDQITRPVLEAFQQMIGQCRICFLYDQRRPIGHDSLSTVRCVAVVAGRIMSVRWNTDGSSEIVLQPGVLTTRTAVLAGEAAGARSDSDDGRNPYIYKLQLTE